MTTEAPKANRRPPVFHRLVKPYMGSHDRLWDKRNLMGSLMAPIEDIYLGMLPPNPDEVIDFHDQIFYNRPIVT